jgi:Putative DNA-binding domain
MILPRDWKEADILSLITNGVKESLELDYKQCASLQKTDGKKREVSKDVSAFANSAGGTIVYGMEEDGQLPIRIDVGYDPADISKEWLDNVISSTISPRLEQVYINPVELQTTRPGKVMYVVEIPQAIARAPHQAQDKLYYKRFNFKSEPMADYEIRDILLRSQGPDLTMGIQSLSRDEEGTVTVKLHIVNNGHDVAKYVTCIGQVVSNYNIVSVSVWEHRDPKVVQLSLGFNNVVYPDIPHNGGSIQFKPIDRMLSPLIFQVGLYAEGMKGRTIPIGIDPNTVPLIP